MILLAAFLKKKYNARYLFTILKNSVLQTESFDYLSAEYCFVFHPPSEYKYLL